MVRELIEITYYADCSCKRNTEQFTGKTGKKDAEQHEQDCIGLIESCEYKGLYPPQSGDDTHYHATVRDIDECDQRYKSMMKKYTETMSLLRCGNGHVLTFAYIVATTSHDHDDSVIKDTTLTIFCNSGCEFHIKQIDLSDFSIDQGYYDSDRNRFSKFFNGLKYQGKRKESMFEKAMRKILDVSHKHVCYFCISATIRESTTDMIHDTRKELLDHLQKAHTMVEIQTAMMDLSLLTKFKHFEELF